ncbi:tRNA pseudouridine(38-40) synthase TruA [Gracilibacillus sp. S3-1-1]|uniref:tRNA pseudouridine(38-40) synthase TruA n=1 Tax=Gracilibacillus pellucidus TaxID=3095368 RepID=A0ACC6M8Q2_9BACI|nr:tRNA pseudouridine(38-40) synthase TruA [Gracilibacillus sp. S3-1-1]MDX8047340.1 tRNA pseudouridine(38-40) synthase TruA [Gracilibacillus sp. S3-1-1]
MRLRAIIRYDGTAFSGYQIQPNGRTVQEEIEKVLTKMHKGKPVRITASGRTDQGVHAVGQVIHFDTDLEIPNPNWVRALNTMLPADIEVVAVKEVPDDFHARFDVSEKEYRYYIMNGASRDIFRRHYVYHVPNQLNVQEMHEASQYFMGRHDFTSFCSANSNVKGDKIRTITDIGVEQQNEDIIIRVRGTGFLYNMVRIIVGTLIDVGTGKRATNEVSEIIAATDRATAGKTAPPQGLYLWEVDYEKKDDKNNDSLRAIY